MKHFSLIAILITVLIMAGCSNKETTMEENLELNFNKGVENFEKERYYKAVDYFTYVVYNSPGSDIADDAQLYLADTHFNLKEYLTAIDEYERLINRWPASELVEQARFNIAESYDKLSPKYQLDQSYTYQAIKSYQSFIQNYPSSTLREKSETRIRDMRSKLARKSYDTGKLYMVLREWNAAIISFNEIMDEYYDTNLIDESHLAMAECYKNLNDMDLANDHIRKVNVDNLDSQKDKIIYHTITQEK